jgi:hypothetical protein
MKEANKNRNNKTKITLEPKYKVSTGDRAIGVMTYCLIFISAGLLLAIV